MLAFPLSGYPTVRCRGRLSESSPSRTGLAPAWHVGRWGPAALRGSGWERWATQEGRGRHLTYLFRKPMSGFRCVCCSRLHRAPDSADLTCAGSHGAFEDLPGRTAGRVGGRGARAWPAPSQAAVPRPCGSRQAAGALREEAALREETGETRGRKAPPAAFPPEGTGVVSGSRYPALLHPGHVIEGTREVLKAMTRNAGPGPELSQERQQPRGGARPT